MHNRKDLQLCRQVFDALTYALADIEDLMILDLVLASVVPAPSAARLQVTLVPAHDNVDPEEALRRANAKFTRRFQHIERRLAEQGREGPQPLDDMEALWVEAKRAEKR